MLLLIGVMLMGTINCANAQNRRPSPLPTKTAESKNGIAFINNNWEAALQKASAEKKLIFADAYADWCGPCKLLKATTFKDKKAAVFFNSHFINLALDVEKGQGQDLAAQWKIQGLPTLIVFDASGKTIAQSVGYLKPEDLVALGKQALLQLPHASYSK
jgi:thiol:disulfide interchange protein